MEKQERLNELDELIKLNLNAGGSERISRQHRIGRLTARERLINLFDPGTFQETGLLMNAINPDIEGKITHINEVSGTGKINGQLSIAHADDVTSYTAGTRAGTQPPRGTNPKLYPELCNPVIHLYDGGDDDTWLQVVPRWGAGDFLAGINGLRKSPRVSAIMGNCIGIPAMQAITSDFVVQVKGTKLGSFDPRMQAHPANSTNDYESLGGWELHAEETGQVDAFADSDEQCLEIIREYLSYMPRNSQLEPDLVPCNDPIDRKLEKLMTIIPDKPNRVYDQTQVIKQIVDDGKYLLLRPRFGKALVTCLARMNGRVVGIIANQTLYNAGAAGYDECDKAADFITICDANNIPLIFLADTPGNLVGKPAEYRRIPTKIMTWMEAMAMSTVPKITIIIRKAYGMAISNMCGTNCGPDFIAAMTTAEISFMSPEAAANVTYLRKIESAPNPAEERARLIAEMRRESSPFPAAQAGLLDDVIDPRDTRRYIIEKLNFLRQCKGDFIGENRLQTWPTGF